MMPVAYKDWLEMPIVQDAFEEVFDGDIFLIPPRRLPHATILNDINRAPTEQLSTEYDVLCGDFGLVISEDPLVCRNPLERAAILTAGVLKPQAFPHVEIDIAQVWPV